jgi:hypothetical protein
VIEYRPVTLGSDRRTACRVVRAGLQAGESVVVDGCSGSALVQVTAVPDAERTRQRPNEAVMNFSKFFIDGRSSPPSCRC